LARVAMFWSREHAHELHDGKPREGPFDAALDRLLVRGVLDFLEAKAAKTTREDQARLEGPFRPRRFTR
ncbi:MAG: hypothetical protein ACAI25_15120, partial [Planctomycetota bacterium]